MHGTFIHTSENMPGTPWVVLTVQKKGKQILGLICQIMTAETGTAKMRADEVEAWQRCQL